MSISGRFWRLTTEEWAKLDASWSCGSHPGDVADAEVTFLDYLFAEEWADAQHYLDIDDSWDLLDYLLQYSQDDPAGVLGLAIQGGTDLPFEDSKGYIRFLTPDEVQKVAHHLGHHSVARLRSHVKMDQLVRVEIYPGFDRWERGTVYEIIERYLPTLIAFYVAAARTGQYVVLARM